MVVEGWGVILYFGLWIMEVFLRNFMMWLIGRVRNLISVFIKFFLVFIYNICLVVLEKSSVMGMLLFCLYGGIL